MTKSKDYLRQIGITEKQFALLLDKLEQEIKNELQINKMKNRGVCAKEAYEKQLVKIQPMQRLTTSIEVNTAL